MYPPHKVRRSKVAMGDLDPKTNIEDQMEPQGEINQLVLGEQ